LVLQNLLLSNATNISISPLFAEGKGYELWK